MCGTEHKKTAWEIKKGPALFHFSRILPRTIHIRYFFWTTGNQTMDRGSGRAHVNLPYFAFTLQQQLLLSFSFILLSVTITQQQIRINESFWSVPRIRRQSFSSSSFRLFISPCPLSKLKCRWWKTVSLHLEIFCPILLVALCLFNYEYSRNFKFLTR